MINIWQKRNLTLIGKIILIKSLFISKFIHILLSLASPNETLFVKIDTLFDKFLWNGKPPKFRKQILEKLVSEGGLNYPNIRHIDATMKISWFNRLYTTCEGWASIPYFYKIDLIYTYGAVYQENLIQTVENTFWNDTIRSLLMLTKQNVFHGDIALLSTPLWFNTRVIPWRLPAWVKKGITTIGDILHKNGEIFSIADIQSTWDIKCNFLLHMSLTNKIRLILPQKDKFYPNLHPKLSHILYDIEIGNKGNKNIYHNTLRDQLDIISDTKDKWSNSFNEEIGNDTVQKSFKTAKKLAPSVYQYYNQYKLLHRRIVNNQLLKRMNIVESENCLFCGQGPETIEHIYLLYGNATDLWRKTTTWVRNIYDHHFIISDHEKIFLNFPRWPNNKFDYF